MFVEVVVPPAARNISRGLEIRIYFLCDNFRLVLHVLKKETKEVN